MGASSSIDKSASEEHERVAGESELIIVMIHFMVRPSAPASIQNNSGLPYELVPKAAAIAVLVNRTNANAENQLRELSEAARTLGLQLHALNASSERDFDAAFAAVAQMRAGALLVAGW